jgi:hypothetical protein
MAKGTSTALVTLLLVVITVSAIMMTYFWTAENSTAVSEQATTVYESNTNIGCLKIESMDVANKKVALRNCGDSELANVVLYVDSQSVGSTNNVPAGTVFEINYQLPSGEHVVYASSQYAKSSTVKVDTNGNVISFDFWFDKDHGDKRLICQ